VIAKMGDNLEKRYYPEPARGGNPKTQALEASLAVGLFLLPMLQF
jgi:hypothetical protein